MTFIHPEIINWVQDYLSTRLSPDVLLTKNGDTWLLGCKDMPTSSALVIPIISDFYVTSSSIDSCISFPCYLPPSELLISLTCPISSASTDCLEKFNTFDLSYDVLGLFVWMLNRLEEIDFSPSLLDSHGRFTAYSSHAFRFSYLDRPIVDEWILYLRKLYYLRFPKALQVLDSTKISISHDVDVLARFNYLKNSQLLNTVLGSLVKPNRTSSLLSFFSSLQNEALTDHDPYNTFYFLINQSSDLGTKSIFNIMVTQNPSSPNALYDVDSRYVRDFLKYIANNSCAFLGLHPSYDAFNNFSMLEYEVNRFRSLTSDLGITIPKLLSRNHYLRWNQSSTPALLDSVGVDIDSTLTYAQLPGFRCGTCFPYRLFDWISKRSLSIYELPLIIMDTSLISKNYLGPNSLRDKFTQISSLVQAVKSVNGHMTLLWHNHNLHYPEHVFIYMYVMRCLKSILK